ncbi:MAG: nuclear transport factor 2 family protein, partial [Actinomycetota bacterium]
VNSCKSSNQAIKIVNNNLAIFTHDVTTSITNNDGTDTVKERETIVFSLAGDRWVAIHEHLSPAS